VPRLQVELRRALDRHETHLRPLHRLADRLGVGLVVLVGLDERAHVLRRHQAHLVAELGEPAREVVRTARRFQADPRRRQVGQPGDQPRPRQPPLGHHLAAPVHGDDVTRRLAKIDPDGFDLHWFVPCIAGLSTRALPGPAGADHPVTRTPSKVRTRPRPERTRT
jgi:hypothetical protein